MPHKTKDIQRTQFPQAREHVFCEGETYFESLIEGICSAEQSIELESYIFKTDSVGLRFIDALTAAAKRGVNVRVLIDGVGSSADGQKLSTRLNDGGVDTKIFHPLPWQVDQYRWSIKQGSFIERLFFFIQKMNQRDHRKLCIIDKQRLWTGSLNICDQHLSVERGGDGWRDLGVLVTGKRVAEVNSTFESIWNQQGLASKKNRFRTILSNLSPVTRRRKYQFITRRIQQAKSRVWIASAYFSPSSDFVEAIKLACQRGAEVRLIVPSHSDAFFFPYLTASYYPELLEAGVEIYEYSPAFLHAKALIVDEYFLIGSTNFNHRSFLHDLELDIALTTKAARQALESRFKADTKEATQITHKQLVSRTWSIYLGWIPRLVRYWL